MTDWLLTDEEIKGQIKYVLEFNPSIPVETLLTPLCQSIVQSCEDKVQTERERIIEEISKTQCSCLDCKPLWDSLKQRIIEGKI